MAIGNAGQPIPIIPSATEIPYLLVPETECLFSDRALRLRNLAHGHTMGDYLRFAAEISMAQHRALSSFPLIGLPCVDTGLPPLAVGAFQRDPAWQQAFLQIIKDVSSQAPQDFAARLLGILAAASGNDLESWAQAYLAGDTAGCDISIMPIVAASLQVYWTALTRQLQDRSIAAGHSANQCPVCNSLPVGSVTHTGAASQGLRYLTCSLCSSQWNMERIRCINCGDSQHVFYYGIEGSDDAIQAETCDSCHTYSKIMHMEKNPAVDIVADDLATMSLDILVGEAGYQRFGLNPLLITEIETSVA